MATGRLPDPNTAPVTAKGDLYTYSTVPAKLAVGSNGETLVADSSATTGLRWQGNFAAGKNKIINGDFGIWQRGTSFTTTTNTYTADRWVTTRDGNGTVTTSQQTFTPGSAPVSGYESQYYVQMACSSVGTSTYYQLQQRIEDVRTLAGQTVTVSFWARLSAGSVSAPYFRVNQIFGSGGSSPISVGTTNFTPTGSWARYSATFTLTSVSGKTIGSGSYIEFDIVVPFTGTNTLQIWGVQIEAGNTATAFQTATGTLAGELAACQRYFANVVPSTADYGTVISMFQATSSTTAKGGIRFPVPMRTSASITLANANNFTLANASYTPIGGSSFTYAIGNTVDCRIDMSVASGLVAGNATALSGNTANLLIQASAEL